MKKNNFTTADIIALRLTAGATKPLLKSVILLMIEDVVLTGGTFEERRRICGDAYEYELRDELTEDLDTNFDNIYVFECGTTLVVTANEAFRVTPTLKDKIIREYGITPVAV